MHRKVIANKWTDPDFVETECIIALNNHNDINGISHDSYFSDFWETKQINIIQHKT